MLSKQNTLQPIIVILGLLFFTSNGLAQSATVSPNAVIEEAVQLLSDRLEGRKDELAKDKDALYALIDEILLPRFARKYAAALVLGKHWRGATAEQRSSFVDAFYNTLLHQYADGLLEFDDSRVQILKFRGDENAKRSTVKTKVKLDDGTQVPVNYGLVKRDDGWLLYDVTFEGISYIRNYRAEFNAEIRKKGLDSVIERLQKQADSETSK